MTPDRRKTRRSGQSGQRGAPPAVTPAVASVSALDDDFVPNEGVNLKNSEVLKDLDNRLSHLSPSQREELKALIFEYPRLFSDVPGRTNIVQHDVDVGDAAPIRPFGISGGFHQLRKYDSDVMHRNLGVCDAAQMNTGVNRQAEGRHSARQTNP